MNDRREGAGADPQPGLRTALLPLAELVLVRLLSPSSAGGAGTSPSTDGVRSPDERGGAT